MFQPRALRGYVTRSFVNTEHRHDGHHYPPQPSLELDMRAPAGLSGAALVVPAGAEDVWQLVSVVYGECDSYTIAEEAHLDPSTGESTSEVRRIVSFGLGHATESVANLSGPATGGVPLKELLGQI
jgi:hypothetical protein